MNNPMQTLLEHNRFLMIEQQIRPWNVLDNKVLELLKLVKREDYVPAAHVALAFGDVEIPLNIGVNGHAGAAMLQPRLEARLLQECQAKTSDAALHIGTGSGYFAALLGHCVAAVDSVEIDPALAAAAQAKLTAHHVMAVKVHTGDAFVAAQTAQTAQTANHSQYDLIVLTGSLPLNKTYENSVPASIWAQLKPNGRIVGVIGGGANMCAVRMVKSADDSVTTTVLFDTAITPLHGVTVSQFTF